MESKHIVFFLFILTGVPTMVIIMTARERFLRYGIFLMISMIPFVYSYGGINFFTDPYYRGTARGYEILMCDLLAISVSITLIINYGFNNYKLIAPGSYLYFIYIIISIISFVNAESILYSGYELMKMIMVYIYFITIFNYIVRYGDFRSILYAFAGTIILNFGYMIIQKYAWHVYQPSGLFPHRNSAAMYANMIAPIFLALILNAKVSKIIFNFFLVIYGMATLMVVFALSRGALLFLPLAASLVTVLSLGEDVSRRKMKVIFVLSLIAILGALRTIPTIVDRFENAPQSSTEGRVELAKIALNMAQDKFWGVGLNNWAIKINPPYDYRAGTAYEDAHPDYKGGLVETVYLLVAGECGWIGFTALIFWMYYYYINAYLNILRYRRLHVVYMAIGVFGGLTAAYGQSCFEWVLKQQTNFYELMTVLAITAAMIYVFKKGFIARSTEPPRPFYPTIVVLTLAAALMEVIKRVINKNRNLSR